MTSEKLTKRLWVERCLRNKDFRDIENVRCKVKIV